jgi:stage II sporulation protein AA (anti-sigma F factor antagonist)
VTDGGQAQLREQLRELPSLAVIDLQGDVTASSRDAMLAAYQEASRLKASDILLNFSRVTYINSGGISAVVALLIETRRAGQRFAVTGLNPHYLKVFQMMGLSQHARIFESEGEARAFAVAQGPAAG